MFLKPQKEDFKVIGYYLGKISAGLGITMLAPLFTAFLFRELNPAFDFISGISVSLALGCLLTLSRPKKTDLSLINGVLIAGISWLLAMALSAIPLFLSGHYVSFLDSLFEMMSGFTTTGLSLTQDLDHLAHSYNLWRHVTQFLGGQGVVIIALAFFIKGVSGAFSLYVGEGRDEKILPNVISTARFIWLVTLVYFLLGGVVLTIIGLRLGIGPGRSIFHAVCIFMAGWDTGGFTPQSQSILYYHSVSYEITTFIIFFLGSINFGLHYLVWSGRRRELWRDIETRTYVATITVTLFITLLGLVRLPFFANLPSILRVGFYQTLSAHAGAGFMTVTASQLSRWNELALLGIILAMAIGGCACSTAGAIKTLRIGIIFKGFWRQMKMILMPEQGIVIEKIHHFRDTILGDNQIAAAGLIFLAYLFLYLLGSLVGVLCGYQFLPSLFESVSAAANVGQTTGITATTMPAVLKVTYILQMWIGRFEFMAIFGLFGFLFSWAKGR